MKWRWLLVAVGLGLIGLVGVYLGLRFKDAALFVGHSFDQGDGGWRVVVPPSDAQAEPEYVDTGGWPGGYIAYQDALDTEAVIPPIDLVIVFDTSGSMEEEIDAVRDNAVQLVEAIRARAPDTRLGLVRFSDLEADGPGAVTHLDLSDDLGAQLAAMGAWTADGGGSNGGEDQYAALRATLGMAWRPDVPGEVSVIRAAIIISDEPPRDPDLNGDTLDSITAAARGQGVRLFPVVLTPHAHAQRAGELLATRTGGQVMGGAGELPELLLQTVDRAIEAGSPWYWQAPDAFHTDWTAEHGAWLTFSLFSRGGGDPLVHKDDVVVTGANGVELSYTLLTPAGPDWRSYAVSLTDPDGWTIRGSGRAPTPQQMQETLASVAGLRIRGEWVIGEDTGGLDNVVLMGVRGEPSEVRFLLYEDADTQDQEVDEVSYGVPYVIAVRLEELPSDQITIRLHAGDASFDVTCSRVASAASAHEFRSNPIVLWPDDGGLGPPIIHRAGRDAPDPGGD